MVLLRQHPATPFPLTLITDAVFVNVIKYLVIFTPLSFPAPDA